MKLKISWWRERGPKCVPYSSYQLLQGIWSNYWALWVLRNGLKSFKSIHKSRNSLSTRNIWLNQDSCPPSSWDLLLLEWRYLCSTDLKQTFLLRFRSQLGKLVCHQIEGYSRACWNLCTDWEGRRRSRLLTKAWLQKRSDSGKGTSCNKVGDLEQDSESLSSSKLWVLLTLHLYYICITFALHLHYICITFA